MSDGLREVLDICDRYERQGTGSASDFDKGAQRAAYDIGLKLRSLLAAHPVEPAAEPQCICHMIVDTYPDPDCPQYSEHIPPAEEGS